MYHRLKGDRPTLQGERKIDQGGEEQERRVGESPRGSRAMVREQKKMVWFKEDAEKNTLFRSVAT